MKKIFLLILIALLFLLYQSKGSLPATIAPKISNTDPAYQDLKKLLNQSLVSNDALMAAKCNEQIGDIFFKEGALPQALEYYYKAYGIFKKKKQRIGHCR